MHLNVRNLFCSDVHLDVTSRSKHSISYMTAAANFRDFYLLIKGQGNGASAAHRYKTLERNTTGDQRHSLHLSTVYTERRLTRCRPDRRETIRPACFGHFLWPGGRTAMLTSEFDSSVGFPISVLQ